MITNEHVVEDRKHSRYANQFHGCEDVFRLSAPGAITPHPIDVAVCEIPDAVWTLRVHQACAVPRARLAVRHNPLPGELLYFSGFPQERSRFLFGALMSIETPLTTQEAIDVQLDDLHPNYFLVRYSTEKARSVDPAARRSLSTPSGLSGSLVWNTRRVECLKNQVPWSPDLAQVTGMLCRWEAGDSALQAVRIEVILDFLTSQLGTV